MKVDANSPDKVSSWIEIRYELCTPTLRDKTMRLCLSERIIEVEVGKII